MLRLTTNTTPVLHNSQSLLEYFVGLLCKYFESNAGGGTVGKYTLSFSKQCTDVLLQNFYQFLQHSHTPDRKAEAVSAETHARAAEAAAIAAVLSISSGGTQLPASPVLEGQSMQKIFSSGAYFYRFYLALSSTVSPHAIEMSIEVCPTTMVVLLLRLLLSKQTICHLCVCV